MEQIPQTYQRLPGARRTPFRKATLWLASDHILSIDSHRFSEEYKRYYFKDIQAIVVRQTTGSTAMSKAIDMVVAIVLALLGVAAWRLQSIGAAAAAGVILSAFLIFKSLGPFCACHLITAVSSDRLPSLDLLRDAEKALGIIGPLVQQAQREQVP
jgi:hypothetical protein